MYFMGACRSPWHAGALGRNPFVQGTLHGALHCHVAVPMLVAGALWSLVSILVAAALCWSLVLMLLAGAL
jgi:hypothetical protein